MAKDRKVTIDDYRVGNCIMYGEEIYRVDEIRGDRIRLKNKAGKVTTEEFEFLHPVKFTEEILRQTKFVKIGNKYSKRVPIMFVGDFTLDAMQVGERWCMYYHVNGVTSSDVYHYLHEIQNLWRLLAGKEWI